MKNIKILQLNKVCKDFYGGVFFLKSESKITYWNIKVRAERATNGERGCLHRTSIFPHPVSMWCQSKHTIGHLVFFKKCKCLCTYISYFMYNKGMGKGQMRDGENYTLVIRMQWNQTAGSFSFKFIYLFIYLFIYSFIHLFIYKLLFKYNAVF